MATENRFDLLEADMRELEERAVATAAILERVFRSPALRFEELKELCGYDSAEAFWEDLQAADAWVLKGYRAPRVTFPRRKDGQFGLQECPVCGDWPKRGTAALNCLECRFCGESVTISERGRRYEHHSLRHAWNRKMVLVLWRQNKITFFRRFRGRIERPRP